MPIQRIPVVHKFGIISHSKRLELQERLAEKVINESVDAKRPFTSRTGQFAIDEDFVKQFNQAEDGSEIKQELESQAEKLFLRAKRKTGLQQGGVGSHVIVKDAWIELSLLAQCNLRSLQDGALNTLYNSLYYSPISKSHIGSLLHLGRTSMQWLTGSTSGQPYLRTGELGLIKVTHLVFNRLYYHHLAGDIKGFHEERQQLIDIVDAFTSQQDIYRPFPTTLLFLRIIMQIGGCLRVALEEEMKQRAIHTHGSCQEKSQENRPVSSALQPDVTGQSCNGEDGEVKDQSLVARTNEVKRQNEVTGGIEVSEHAEVIREHSEVRRQSEVRRHSEVKGLLTADLGVEIPHDEHSYESLLQEGLQRQSNEQVLGGVPTVHDTSPILWHSLNLWRTVTHTYQELVGPLRELIGCRLDFVRAPLLDSVTALHVLCEVAKINHRTLFVMQQIARQDIFKANEAETEPERSSKHRLNSRMISTQVLSDPLQTTAEKGNSLQNTDSKCEMDGDNAQEAAIGDSVKSSAGLFDRLMDFLEPKPTPVVRQELGQKEIPGELKVYEGILDSQDASDSRFIDRDECQIGRGVDFTERSDDISHHDENSDLNAESSNRDSPLSDTASLSDGSLADLSSLASDKPRYEYKIRSSRRRHKKKNSSEDAGQSSDESAEELGDRKAQQSRNKEYSQTRESSVSLNYPNQSPGITSPGHTITRPNTQLTTTATKWPWELVVSFVRCMGEICLHGSKSRIQRDALMGCQGNEAGLLQYLKFQLQLEQGSASDWSWRVRHVTVQQLTTVCEMMSKDALKDGLQNAAWTALLSHHSTEVDRRVLEAYKIARTEADLESNVDIPMEKTYSLYSRISTNLAIIHVAPLTDKVDYSASAEFTKFMRNIALCNTGDDELLGQRSKASGKLGERQIPQNSERSKAKRNRDHGRVSIRNEIMIATALDENTQSLITKRSWADVRAIAEDQWRKEMIEEYEIVERQRQDVMEREIERIRETLPTQSLRERVKF